MTLGEIRTLARASLPTAKKTRITDPNLDIIINIVIKDINILLKLLPDNSKFTITAEKEKYDLSLSSETVERFGKIDKSGVWWNAGSASSPDWRRLYPRTLKWLDKKFQQWRDADSSDPLYYAKKGKYLYLYPTPDTTLTDGLWLYYIEQTQDMSKDEHYPFGYETEISEYSILTDCIIAGIKVYLVSMVNKLADKQAAYAEYMALIEQKRRLLRENLDIRTDKETKMRIPYAC